MKTMLFYPKTTTAWLVVCGLMIIVSACQKNSLETDDFPPTTVVNSMPADKSDLSLKVLAISFPGIPAGDVKIDHVARVISVKAPAEFTADDMTPTVQVSDSAQVYELGNLKSPALWCACCQQNLAVKLLKKGTQPWLIRNQYVINPVYSRTELTLQPLSKPIEVALGETAAIAIPVSNLYRGVLPERAVLTNEKTGMQYVVYSQYSLRVSCSYAAANTISISLNEQKVVPGQYRVVLYMPSGREIPILQPIIARAGKPYVSNNVISESEPFERLIDIR